MSGTTSNEVKCPFCGATALVSQSPSRIGGRYWVYCTADGCADGPMRDTPEAALEAWQSVINRNELLPVLDEISRLQNKFDDWEGELIEVAVKDIAKHANEQIDAMNSVQRRQSGAESEAD